MLPAGKPPTAEALPDDGEVYVTGTEIKSIADARDVENAFANAPNRHREFQRCAGCVTIELGLIFIICAETEEIEVWRRKPELIGSRAIRIREPAFQITFETVWPLGRDSRHAPWM